MGTAMDEQSMDHISLKRQSGLDVVQSHPLCKFYFGQYQVSSVMLGWLGEGNCHGRTINKPRLSKRQSGLDVMQSQPLDRMWFDQYQLQASPCWGDQEMGGLSHAQNACSQVTGLIQKIGRNFWCSFAAQNAVKSLALFKRSVETSDTVLLARMHAVKSLVLSKRSVETSDTVLLARRYVGNACGV